MSACINCPNAKPLARCGTVIELGVISQINTDVLIYVREVSTGRIDQYQTTSEADGTVAYSFSAKTFNEDSFYEFWMTLDELYTSPEDKLSFTIDGEITTNECFFVEFISINGTISSQTVQLL